MSAARASWDDVPEGRRRIMRAIRSRDTKPELALRSMLHARGYRFRLHRRDLPGTPDVVFPARRAAIEVRGCFFHAHPGCPRARVPATRREYWGPKLEANAARDARNARALRRLGWRLMVVWECEMGDAARVMRRAERFLGAPGNQLNHSRAGARVSPSPAGGRGGGAA